MSSPQNNQQGPTWKLIKNTGLSNSYEVKVSHEYFVNWATRNRTHKEIKGFRPGKAPLSFFKEDFIKFLAQDTLAKVCETENIPNIVNATYLEKAFDEGKGIEIELNLEKYPTIPSFDFASQEITEYTCEVRAKDVEDAMQKWASSNTYEVELSSPRPVQKGDILTIDISITDETGKTEHINNFRAEVGKRFFLPEIDDKFIGLNVNDVITHDFSFPKDAQNLPDPSLAGKSIKIKLLVKKITGTEYYKVGVEMAKAFSCSSVEECKKKFKQNIESDVANINYELSKKEILKYMTQEFFDVPMSLVSAEYQKLRREFLREAGVKMPVENASKEDIEKHVMEKFKLNMQDFENRLIYISQLNVRVSMILHDVAQKWNLQVLPMELDTEISAKQAQFGGLKEALAFFEKNKSAKENLHKDLMQEKAWKRIILECKNQSKTVTLDELQTILIESVSPKDTVANPESAGAEAAKIKDDSKTTKTKSAAAKSTDESSKSEAKTEVKKESPVKSSPKGTTKDDSKEAQDKPAKAKEAPAQVKKSAPAEKPASKSEPAEKKPAPAKKTASEKVKTEKTK